MFDLLPKPSKTINQLVSYKLKFNGSSLDDEIKVFAINVNKQINKISRASISIFGGQRKKQRSEIGIRIRLWKSKH